MFENLAYGFLIALKPTNLIYAVIGVFLGTIVGVLPGIGPPTTIALLLPLTYGIELTPAIIMLAGIFYGAMYGGSTTSILVNLPGEAASVVTTFDGYQMAKQGRAGAALAIAAIGSFVAGTISVVGLTALSQPLSEVALRFGPPEYFGLTLLGLTLVSYLASGSMVRGLLMALLGLFLGLIGMDPVQGTRRFTFGILELNDGLDFVPITMGLFGIGEVLYNLAVKEEFAEVLKATIDWGRNLREVLQTKWAILRGTLVGFFVGILPGGGAIVSSLLSYAVEKRVARDPSRFGKGAPEGVAGPESANNAAATSSMIPLLLLGVPGNASTALILAALLIHGVRPGPFLLQDHPDLFWGVVASMYIGNVLLLVMNLPLVNVFVQLLRIPYRFLAVLIVLLSIVGSYSVNNSIFDVWILLLFGILGFLFRILKFDVGPLIIAFVLGPIVELSLRQSLIMSRGSLGIFLIRPAAAIFLLAAVVILMTQVIQAFWRVLVKAPMHQRG
ncbi:MAG: tripartite tricarboxylate transporter permease [Armatimonadota bacterium]|nr:tripartite tricarboxylate transporter permease [Armatimonadota bacterium]